MLFRLVDGPMFEAHKLWKVGRAEGISKEATKEKAAFTRQLVIFETAKGENILLLYSFSRFFVSCCPRYFKQGQAELT